MRRGATRSTWHEPLKVAIVRARYTSHGGAERFAERAMQAIASYDDEVLDVAVIARRWTQDASTEAIRLIRCDPFYLGSVWRDASFARAVRACVATERFDLVQSHERIAGLPIYRAGDGVHAAWLERRTRASTWSHRIGIALNPHHRYLVAVEREMFEHRGLRAVICNSRMVMDEIAARFAIDPSKLHLVRNGVDIELFHPDVRAMHRSGMRDRLGIDGSTPTFVLVGSGFERKGVAEALHALVDVDDAVLVVLGTDKHADRYRALAEALGVAPRVRFIGAVDDVLPYLSLADVFLAPTLYDPFPNAVLEAWACGLPVLTSDASGAAELIEQGINGWIVSTNDQDALVAAMTAAARSSAQTVASMSAAARATAVPLSLTTLANALVALYRTLLAAH